jgi:glutaredoxin 3
MKHILQIVNGVVIMKNIVIYTSTGCQNCHDAMEFFKDNNIEYIEHNISNDIESKRMLIKKGYRSVPVIVIDGEEIIGFDKDTVMKRLEI